MCEATIKPQHLSVFEDRLQKIKPHLDRAKNILSNQIVPEYVYITGECAAWLIGRTDSDKFSDIGIYLLNHGNRSACYERMFHEFIECRDGHIDHVSNLFWSPEVEKLNIARSRYTLIEFSYRGTPSLKFTYTFNDIHFTTKYPSDLPALSVFINLYNPKDIRTTECRCSYESKCSVTQNGCMRHGRVEYPFSLGPIYSEEEDMVDDKHWCMVKEKFLNIEMAQLDLTKSYYTSTELFMNHNLYENRIMSFCEYSCSKCNDRDKLTRKYADKWVHNTYAPGGYGYKVAAQRFKNIDTDTFIQYCTCTSLNKVSKRLSCDRPN